MTWTDSLILKHGHFYNSYNVKKQNRLAEFEILIIIYIGGVQMKGGLRDWWVHWFNTVSKDSNTFHLPVL